MRDRREKALDLLDFLRQARERNLLQIGSPPELPCEANALFHLSGTAFPRPLLQLLLQHVTLRNYLGLIDFVDARG